MNQGAVGYMDKLGITESYRVKLQVLVSAAEAAEMILRVDDIIKAAPRYWFACACAYIHTGRKWVMVIHVHVNGAVLIYGGVLVKDKIKVGACKWKCAYKW